MAPPTCPRSSAAHYLHHELRPGPSWHAASTPTTYVLALDRAHHPGRGGKTPPHARPPRSFSSVANSGIDDLIATRLAAVAMLRLVDRSHPACYDEAARTYVPIADRRRLSHARARSRSLGPEGNRIPPTREGFSSRMSSHHAKPTTAGPGSFSDALPSALSRRAGARPLRARHGGCENYSPSERVDFADRRGSCARPPFLKGALGGCLVEREVPLQRLGRRGVSSRERPSDLLHRGADRAS